MSPETLIVQIKRFPGNEDIPLPSYKSENAVAMDICAAVKDKVDVPPLKFRLIPTGFSIALPNGFEAQLRPRSGLALEKGIGILNSPGTIDSDFRGEIQILLINLGDDLFVVERGMRIAQMVISPVLKTTWELVEKLSETSRGDGGWGHTGHF